MPDPKKRKHSLHRFGIALRRCILSCIALILAAVFYLSLFGLPNRITASLLELISHGPITFEADSIRLTLPRSIELSRVRMFQKGVIGPAAIEAGKMTIVLRLHSFLNGRDPIKEIRIRRGICRFKTLIASSLLTPSSPPSTSEAPSTHFRLRLTDSTALGIKLENLQAEVVIDSDHIRFENLQASARVDGINGDIMRSSILYRFNDHMLDGHFFGQFDPNMLIPLFQELDLKFPVRLVERFKIDQRRPGYDMNVRAHCGTPWSLAFDGQCLFQDGSYEGVQISRADGTVRMYFSEKQSYVTVDPISIQRGEGNGRGALTVDMDRQTIQFNGESTLHPKALASMIGILTNGQLNSLSFNGRSAIRAEGVVDYGEFGRSKINAEVQTTGLGVGPFMSDHCNFSIEVLGITNHIRNITGRMYSGEFRADATFVDPDGSRSNVLYSIQGGMKDVDFAKLVSILRQTASEDYKGKFSTEARIDGLIGTGMARTVQGTVSLSIKEGRVFMLPIFGGLSTLLTGIIPGLDFVLRQSDAQADFVIVDGVARSERVDIMGDILSLSGRGSVSVEQELDFDVRIQLMKEHVFVGRVLNLFIYPFSKLFEFKLKGSPDNPVWYPVNFSRDLLKKLGLADKKLPDNDHQQKMETVPGEVFR